MILLTQHPCDGYIKTPQGKLVPSTKRTGEHPSGTLICENANGEQFIISLWFKLPYKINKPTIPSYFQLPKGQRKIPKGFGKEKEHFERFNSFIQTKTIREGEEINFSVCAWDLAPFMIRPKLFQGILNYISKYDVCLLRNVNMEFINFGKKNLKDIHGKHWEGTLPNHFLTLGKKKIFKILPQTPLHGVVYIKISDIKIKILNWTTVNSEFKRFNDICGFIFIGDRIKLPKQFEEISNFKTRPVGFYYDSSCFKLIEKSFVAEKNVGLFIAPHLPVIGKFQIIQPKRKVAPKTTKPFSKIKQVLVVEKNPLYGLFKIVKFEELKLKGIRLKVCAFHFTLSMVPITHHFIQFLKKEMFDVILLKGMVDLICENKWIKETYTKQFTNVLIIKEVVIGFARFKSTIEIGNRNVDIFNVDSIDKYELKGCQIFYSIIIDPPKTFKKVPFDTHQTLMYNSECMTLYSYSKSLKTLELKVGAFLINPFYPPIIATFVIHQTSSPVTSRTLPYQKRRKRKKKKIGD